MSKKKDHSVTKYEPSTGAKKTREAEYHLRSARSEIVVDDPDSGNGSERASITESEGVENLFGWN